MPITKSAQKALRVAVRRKVFNDRRTKAMKLAVKKVEKAVREKKDKEVSAAMSLAFKAIDKAARSGVTTKNTAARKKARLARLAKNA
jgi:ribosomal protein S20